MSFLYPVFIYLMLLPALVLVYLIVTDKDHLERYFDMSLLSKLRIEGDSLGRRGHYVLLFFIFFLMVLALARPVINRKSTTLSYPKVDLLIIVDDGWGNSVSKADHSFGWASIDRHVRALLYGGEYGRAGLLWVGRLVWVLTPLSADRQQVAAIWSGASGMQEERVSRGDPSSVVRAATMLLRHSRHGLILLISSNPLHGRIERIIQAARQKGHGVIFWYVGAKQDAALERLKRDALCCDPSLGPLFVVAGVQEGGRIRSIVQTVAHALPHGVYNDRVELFYYPLGLALLLLPFGLYSIRPTKPIVGLFMGGLLMGFPSGARGGLWDFWTIQKAYEAYEKGAYAMSAKLLESLAQTQHSAAFWYDLGNSYYKSGQYRRACQAYARVVSMDRMIEAAKLYNLGNCYVRLGRFDKAAQMYHKALALHEDPDARANLALIAPLLTSSHDASSHGDPPLLYRSQSVPTAKHAHLPKHLSLEAWRTTIDHLPIRFFKAPFVSVDKH